MGTLREQILAAEDLPREQVSTDEWAPFGVPFVHVRGLASGERDDWEQSFLTTGANGKRVTKPQVHNVRAGFVALTVVDEAGQRVFTDKDIAALATKSAAVIGRLWDVGRRLSGMKDEDDEENPSEGGQEDTSSSDSPSPSDSPTSTV